MSTSTRRWPSIAIAIGIVLALILTAVASTVARAADDTEAAAGSLEWRRVATKALTSGTRAVDAASDGMMAAILLSEQNGKRLRLLTSPNGHDGWETGQAFKTKPGALDLGHDDAGWYLATPSGTWRSSDGTTWNESDEAMEPMPGRVGEWEYAVGTGIAARQRADGSDVSPVPELLGATFVGGIGDGGVAIGEQTIFFTDDAETWERSSAAGLDVTEATGAAMLDDGSLIVTGIAPAFGSRSVPAIWIGEAPGTSTAATMEEAKAHYDSVARRYLKDISKLPTTVSTWAQVRRVGKARAAAVRKMLGRLEGFAWPGEVAPITSAQLAAYGRLQSAFEGYGKTRNERQFKKHRRAVVKVDPWTVDLAYRVRELLGLEISKSLANAYAKQQRG